MIITFQATVTREDQYRWFACEDGFQESRGVLNLIHQKRGCEAEFLCLGSPRNGRLTIAHREKHDFMHKSGEMREKLWLVFSRTVSIKRAWTEIAKIQ